LAKQLKLDEAFAKAELGEKPFVETTEKPSEETAKKPVIAESAVHPAKELAKMFDAVVEAAEEKGISICPYCFDANASSDGWRSLGRAGVKTQMFKCHTCFRRFRGDWLPVSSHALPNQTCLVLTLFRSGLGVEVVADALKFLSLETADMVPLSKASISVEKFCLGFFL